MPLASDNGQQTSANSTSVVEASDSPMVTGQAALNAKFPVAAAAGDAEVNATASTSMRSRLFGFNGTTWDRLRAGLTTISATLTGYLNTIPTALFRASPTTRTEGQGGPFEADAKGNLRTAEQAPPAYENPSDACASTHDKPAVSAAYNAIAYSTFAKATNGVIKAAPGNLYKITFVNTNAATKVVALVNKAAAPTTDAPVCYYYVPALGQITVEFKFGLRFSVGIAWAQVTTVAASTITLDTADMLVSGAECS